MDPNAHDQWDKMAALVARQHRRDHPAYTFSPQHTKKENRNKAAPMDVVERTQTAQDVRLPEITEERAAREEARWHSRTSIHFFRDIIYRDATHDAFRQYNRDALCFGEQYIQEMQSQQFPASAQASESPNSYVPQCAAPQPILQHLNPLSQSIPMDGFTNNVITQPDAENPPLDEFSALFTPLGEYQAQPLGYNAGDTILVPPIYTTSSAYSSASFCPHLMTLYSPSQQTTPYTASSAEGSYRVSQCYISSCMSFAIPGTPGQQHLFEPVSERLHSLVTMQGPGVSHRRRSDQLNSLEAETQYWNGIPSGSMPLDERWSRQMPSEFEQRGDWSRSVPPHITVQCQ